MAGPGREGRTALEVDEVLEVQCKVADVRVSPPHTCFY
jgi:hypothetical protein